ncbi:MAG: GrpB family protein [Bacteroidales bacterium]|jgi:GrpB-like predicted nucleotidyltransferase (UPF0157 family)|nr:GrpB family protein [Bacteroidales bacterium]
MTKEELGQLYPIVVKPYNLEWVSYYEDEKIFLLSLFADNLLVEHIGSTAVVGLSAKPTIDILLEKPDGVSDKGIIDIFESYGYIHMKEQTNHLMFVKGYTPEGIEDISYHIHISPLNQSWLWDRTYFRDYLNLNNELKMEYQDIKIKLAGKYRNDREAYTESKSDFIKRVTEEAKRVLG